MPQADSCFWEDRLAEAGRAVAQSRYIAVVIWDADERIVEANPAFWDLLGYSPQEKKPARLRLVEMTPQKYRALDRRAAESLQRHGTFPLYAKCFLGRDGTEKPVMIGGAALQSGGIGFVFDQSERSITEQALRLSEGQFRTLAQNVPGVVYLCENDERHTFRFLSEAIEELTGIPSRKFYDRRANLADLVHPEDAPVIAKRVEAALARRQPYLLVYRLRHASGQWRWVEEHGQGIIDEGRVKLVEGVILDITARKQADDALREAQDQLERRVEERTRELQEANDKLKDEQAFLRHTLEQHERSRQVISYEIHDGLAQYITGGLLRLDAYARGRWPKKEEAADQTDPKFEIGMGLLRKSLDEARRLISGLRPPILDESGLAAAIEYLIQEQAELSGRIEFIHDARIDRLPALWESNLFRIVQEALTNVVKHSEAPSVSVELRQDGEMLRLQVADSGKGFDPGRIAKQTHGLDGIRYRARLLGGKASIQSSPGQGVVISFEAPLPKEPS